MDQNRVLAEKVARWAKEGLPVIGIDLAGPESANTLEDQRSLEEMSELYEIAGPKIGRTVHCGESEAVSLETFKTNFLSLLAVTAGSAIKRSIELK